LLAAVLQAVLLLELQPVDGLTLENNRRAMMMKTSPHPHLCLPLCPRDYRNKEAKVTLVAQKVKPVVQVVLSPLCRVRTPSSVDQVGKAVSISGHIHLVERISQLTIPPPYLCLQRNVQLRLRPNTSLTMTESTRAH